MIIISGIIPILSPLHHMPLPSDPSGSMNRVPVGPPLFTSVTRAQGYELTDDGRFFNRDENEQWVEVPIADVPQTVRQEIVDQCQDPVLQGQYRKLLLGKKTEAVRDMLKKLLGR